jgi:leucyl/phenylalanyl-tRNA--protein transferase
MLSPELLIQAYLSGSFPMADPDEDNQIFWHTPEQRGLIPLDHRFKVPKNLARLYRKGVFETSINRDFEAVIRQCAALRPGDTWISEEIIEAYCELNRIGLAHSFEVWQNDQLVGGLYGVALGKVFCGESMFHTVTDASKIALVFLVEFLREQKFELLDTQYLNPHLLQFGAYEVSQEFYMLQFNEILNRSLP